MQEKMQKALDNRINQEVGKRKALERRLDSVDKRFQDDDRQKIEALPMPKIDDFLDQPNPEVSFYEAMDKRKAMIKTVAKPEQPQAQPDLSQSAQDYTAKEDVYAATNPTYMNDVQVMLRFVTPELQSALFDTDPQTVHALSKDLNRVQQLSTLTPSQIGREIAKFEISNKQGKSAPKRTQGKPEPTSNNRGTTVKKGSLENLTYEQHNEMMRNL